ncbi:hypothetical protein OPV22_020062 [Ensete ventricosum]|uniref:Secreted protein n=1 Tax=Ensete ventricosum TaxID=4639 RepID=A0AAV8QM61_ENSVE|nr:hypothetical protein OPV22_020062 [Ensete ventricosum]
MHVLCDHLMMASCGCTASDSPCISSPFPSLLLHLVGVHLAGEDTGIVTPPGRNRRSVAPSLASPSRCNSCLLTDTVQIANAGIVSQ